MALAVLFAGGHLSGSGAVYVLPAGDFRYEIRYAVLQGNDTGESF